MTQYKLFHFLTLFILIQIQVFRQHIKVKTHRNVVLVYMRKLTSIATIK